MSGGKWLLRRYLGEEKYTVETIGTADDQQGADGDAILSYSQAQEKVRKLAKEYRRPAPDASKLTVKDAIEAYLQGGRGRDQHIRLAKHVLDDKLAEQSVASFTEITLESWRKRLPENLSAATIVTDLRAALNAFAKVNRKDLPDDMQIRPQ